MSIWYGNQYKKRRCGIETYCKMENEELHSVILSEASAESKDLNDKNNVGCIAVSLPRPLRSFTSFRMTKGGGEPYANEKTQPCEIP